LIIFLRKFIEEEIAKSQNDATSMDAINDLTYKTRHRELRLNIEKIILLNMEFWSQLSEERPGFSKKKPK